MFELPGLCIGLDTRKQITKAAASGLWATKGYAVGMNNELM